MTDKRETKHCEEWNSKAKVSHTIDPRIVQVVRLLARRSAEQDYRHYLMSTTSLSPTSGKVE